METITKSEPAGICGYPYTYTSTSTWTGGGVINSTTYHGTGSCHNGANVITYEKGPRYLYDSDGRRRPNWKYCVHTRDSFYQCKPISWNVWRYYDTNNRRTIFEDGTMFPGTDVNWLGAFTPPAFPPAPSMEEVYGAVWADIAHRANDNFFLLEDVAGLLSGRSLWSGIKSVASGTQMLARTVSQLKRVRRHFGGKQALYQLWQSAKDELCRVIGLRLGYRFSFKTTLNDVALTAGLVDGFNDYLRQLHHRQTHIVCYRSKRQNVESSTAQSLNMRNACSPCLSGSIYNGVPFPRLRVTKKAVNSAEVRAYASVRYTADRTTIGRYIARKFGIDKPLSTLWAIVPLSFLVDYLVPVQEMMSYMDNWLNDYDIVTTFQSAWAIKHRYRCIEIPYPAIQASAANIQFRSTAGFGRAVATEYFERTPVSTDLICDQFPPLIDAGQNWYRRVGTGLEILTQLRHR